MPFLLSCQRCETLTNFSDGSKASAESTSPDWFRENHAIAIQGVDRVGINTGVFEDTSVNPKLFDCPIDLKPTDELNKLRRGFVQDRRNARSEAASD